LLGKKDYVVVVVVVVEKKERTAGWTWMAK